MEQNTPFEFTDMDVKPEFSEEELAYHAELAEQRGIRPDDVTHEQELIFQLSAVATQLDVKFKDLLIRSEWRQSELPHPQLVLQSPVPEEAWTIIKSAPFEIDVVVTDGPTVDQSNAVIDSLLSEMREQGNTGLISAHHDPISDTYSIEYSREEVDTGSIAARVAPGENVEVRYLGAEDVGGADYRGGEPISTVTPTCTSGFVVRNGSTYGIATAGHCLQVVGNYAYMDGYFASGGRLNPDYGDIRWGWGLSGTPTTAFRSTTTQFLSVTGVATPTIGMGHCVYGKTTLTSCGTVGFVGQSYDLSNDDVGTLHRIFCDTTSHNDSGDSGGPVFGGGTALGLHSARPSINGALRSCFTGVVNLYNGAYVDINR